MKSNTKITLIIFSMVLLLTSIIVVLVAIGSRQIGYDAVKKKAYLTADIVKNSLTSHMVNGNMAQRDVFLYKNQFEMSTKKSLKCPKTNLKE